MDRRVAVESIDQRQKGRFGGLRRQRVLHREEADFLRLLAFARNVDFARSIVSDEHDRKSRHDSGFRLEAPRFLGYPRGDLRGDGAPVNGLSGRRRCERH